MKTRKYRISNKEFRMLKEDSHFEIRNSLFDIRFLSCSYQLSLRLIQKMLEFFFRGADVFAISLVGRNLDRHALDDAQPVAIQTDDLFRIVGEESNLPDAQINQNLRADAVMTQIRAETKPA